MYLQEQFRLLYNSVDNISTDKMAGDVMSFKIKELEDQKQVLINQIEDLGENVNTFIMERDKFREDTKDILELK
jgi:hypothetical protein